MKAEVSNQMLFRLLPLYLHRYVLSGADVTEWPVLSLHGLDNIIYSWSIKDHLFDDHGEHIYNAVHRLEDAATYEQFCKECEQAQIPYEEHRTKHIPYWKEFLIYCNPDIYYNKTT